MEPKLLKHATEVHFSFKCWKNANPYIHNPWHFHEELEITYIEKNRGTLFVGDSIQPFRSGDVILLGSFLPHEFHSDNQPRDKRDYESESISIHFKKDFPGKKIYRIPEFRLINKLIKTSAKGIFFSSTPHLNMIRELIANMLHQASTEKILSLFKILSLMADSKDVQYLASSGFIESLNKTSNNKINKVHEYIRLNFKNSISLEEISALVNMTKTSFCRFFKSRTHKNFVQYLNEIRIGYACKLLLEENKNIAQIAYDSGFNNLSTFNKNFRDIKGMTPTKYRDIRL